MPAPPLRATHIGGPTTLLEIAGLRLLTDPTTEAVEAARAFPRAVIVPLHYAGWAHFSEGRAEIEGAFEAAGLSDRVCWLEPGRATLIPLAPV